MHVCAWSTAKVERGSEGRRGARECMYVSSLRRRGGPRRRI